MGKQVKGIKQWKLEIPKFKYRYNKMQGNNENYYCLEFFDDSDSIVIADASIADVLFCDLTVDDV